MKNDSFQEKRGTILLYINAITSSELKAAQILCREAQRSYFATHKLRQMLENWTSRLFAIYEEFCHWIFLSFLSLFWKRLKKQNSKVSRKRKALSYCTSAQLKTAIEVVQISCLEGQRSHFATFTNCEKCWKIKLRFFAIFLKFFQWIFCRFFRDFENSR